MFCLFYFTIILLSSSSICLDELEINKQRYPTKLSTLGMNTGASAGTNAAKIQQSSSATNNNSSNNNRNQFINNNGGSGGGAAVNGSTNNNNNILLNAQTLANNSVLQNLVQRIQVAVQTGFLNPLVNIYFYK